MGKLGRPSAIAVEEIEAYNRAVATVADVRAKALAAQATLAAAESRLETAALDTLGDDKAFASAELEASKARAAVRQLTLAMSEAEKRRDDAERTMRIASAKKQVDRALKALAERDEAGKRLEAAVAVLAREWSAMCAAAEKAHSLLAGIIPASDVSRSGFMLHSAELESLLAREQWRVSGSPMLPGSERPIRLDGVPLPYTSETAPSLSANLADATELARQIVSGTRNYRGDRFEQKPEAAKPSRWSMPWRHKNDKAIDERREQAASNPIAAMKAERQSHEARQSAFAAIAGADNMRLPNESHEQWLERVSRPEPMTDAERAALHAPPTGTPTRTAEEVMAEVRSQGGYSTLIDARQPKTSEDW